MVSRPTEPCWAFIIDTDAYAGNFERAMTAHITGVCGACHVGKEYTNDKPYPYEHELVMQVPDEYGCSRPCTVWNTPGQQNENGHAAFNSVLIYLNRRPTLEEITHFKERAYGFKGEAKRRFPYGPVFRIPQYTKITGFRLMHFETRETYEDITELGDPWIGSSQQRQAFSEGWDISIYDDSTLLICALDEPEEVCADAGVESHQTFEGDARDYAATAYVYQCAANGSTMHLDAIRQIEQHNANLIEALYAGLGAGDDPGPPGESGDFTGGAGS